MLKILLTGSTGQLGRNIIAIAPSHIFKNEIEIYAPNRNQLDLSNLKDCRKIILDYKPDYILILAWNFTEDILEKLRVNIDWSLKCIIPLPKLRIVEL